MASLLFRLFCSLALTVFIGIQSVRASPEKVQAKADQAEILNCVGMVLGDEACGFIDIIGDKGFSLLIGNKTVVAGGRLGKGRVIGAGHTSFLNPEPKSDKKSDRATFITNMFEWVSQGNLDRVVLVRENDHRTLGTFQAHFEHVEERVKYPEKADADVEVVDGLLLASYAPKLIERVKRGMGLIILTTNWNLQQFYSTEAEFNSKYAPNIIARAAGFSFRYSDEVAGNGGKGNKYWAAVPRKCKEPAKAVMEPYSKPPPTNFKKRQ